MVFKDIVYQMVALLGNVGILIVGLGVVGFMWGLVSYIMRGGDETKRRESIQYMTWGIIGIFVMVALWSLVYVVAGLIGSDISIPTL